MVERKKIGDSEREVICMYLYVALIKIQVISNVRKILLCIRTLRGARFAIRVVWQLYITVLQRSIYRHRSYILHNIRSIYVHIRRRDVQAIGIMCLPPSFCTLK